MSAVRTQATGLIVADGNLIIRYVNPAAAELLSRTEDTLIGLPVRGLFPDVGSDDIDLRILTSLTSGLPATFEARSMLPGRSFRALSRPIPGGLSIQFEDVSSTADAPLSPTSVLTLLKEVADAADLAVVVRNLDGHVMFSNHSAPAALDALDREAARSDHAVVQERRYRIDGHDQTLLETHFPLHDDDGAVTGICELRADVSDLRRALGEVDALEEQVRATGRLEAVGEMAGGTAHDFNNILTAIIGYVDLLGPAAQHDPQARRALAGLRTATGRAAELIRQLLAFARNQPVRPRVMDLREILLDLHGMLLQLLPRQMELSIRVPEPGPILADLTQIQQVVVNLVLNARDALAQNGSIDISVDTIELDDDPLHVLPPGPYVCLVVSDDGNGMTPEVLARCFEPFFTTHQGAGGTGLGLSTALRITRQNRGDLRISSSPGRGTRCTVLLPAYADVEGDAVAAQSLPDRDSALRISDIHAPTRTRLLLVEDDAQAAGITHAILRRAGYEVHAVPDAMAALSLLSSRQGRGSEGSFDVVATDISLPGMDGIAFARELADEYPGLPVLFLSGSFVADVLPVDGSTVEGLTVEGFPEALLVRKPYSSIQLLDSLRMTLATASGSGHQQGGSS